MVIGFWLKSCQRWDRGLSDLLLMALGRGERDSGYGYVRKLLQEKLKPSSVQHVLAEESRVFAPRHNWEVAALQYVDKVAWHQFSCQATRGHDTKLTVQMAALSRAKGTRSCCFVLGWTKYGCMGKGW